MTVRSDVGWNVAVPPNGFVNRPRQTAASNDNPDGLATPDLYADVETTPEYRNLAKLLRTGGPAADCNHVGVTLVPVTLVPVPDVTGGRRTGLPTLGTR